MQDTSSNAAADFVAGWVGGAAGILIGSPLDVIKVRLQTFGKTDIATTRQLAREGVGGVFRGILPPLFGLGFLNSILFVTYGRSLSYLTSYRQASLLSYYGAGFISGLACWIVSAPVEVVKCRAQIQTSARHLSPSLHIAASILKTEGIKGLYASGTITLARDAIGYGFYFAGYEGMKSVLPNGNGGILIAGGLAGCLSWLSIFPLDVIKSRMQSTPQLYSSTWDCVQKIYAEGSPLLSRHSETTEGTPLLRTGGISLFWRGVGVTMFRAFIVNAVTFFTYEWVFAEWKRWR